MSAAREIFPGVRRARAVLFAGLLTGGLPLFTAAAEPVLDQQKLDFFEQKIRPILVEHCYECHSASAKKVKGGLLLDTREGLLKGGDTEPPIVPGEPDKSLLIKSVRYTDKDLQMPPKDRKLSDGQIADLEAWVKMGAPDPRTGQPALTRLEKLMEAGRTHWAFQPVQSPAVPAVKDAAWVRTPVDAFVRAKLEEKNLPPSPCADKRTLIRRVYFDLIGLPPSPKAVDAFVADDSPGAFESVVDRLLESPAYGERWGRHWLDVARYADNMGSISTDAGYPNAWTYRDYVIRAFNEDKPFDAFLREQIAADLLPNATPEDNRSLAALGFLTVGRRKDSKVDDDVYDDRIDVLTRGLMGLSVGCARCHDHKLEPIPARDYYSLYGVLHSCKEPEVLPAMKPLPETPERRAFARENEKVRAAFVETYATQAAKTLATIRSRVGDYLLAAHDGKHQRTSLNPKFRRELVTQRKLHERVYNDLIAAWDSWVEKKPEVFGPWLELEALTDAEFAAQAQERAPIFAANADAKLNPLVAKMFADGAPASLHELAARYNALFAEVDKRWRPLAEDALAKCRALRPGDLVLSAKDLELAAIQRVYEPDQSVPLPEADGEKLRQVLVGEGAPTVVPPDQFSLAKLFAEDAVKEIAQSKRAFGELEKHPGAPPRFMALFEDKPYDAQVFIRGNPKVLGAPAPRQFLEILSGAQRRPFPANTSGRLELARAITSPENPLTARVIVNRVWQWHFGEGLVRTPSNFGLQGEPPTHPKLLDFLTARFVADGWSIKKLHKLLVLSSVYQQRSESSPELTKADPENRWLARMNPRPLDFESFRDATLTVAGLLETSEGGPSYDIHENRALRRTVYALVDRKSLPNVFRSFDFPDPNYSAAQRSHTALTPQALYLLNSTAIVDSAKALAARSQTEPKEGNESAVRLLYRLAYQREPDDRELQRALAYLALYPPHDSVMPEVSAWTYGFGDFDAPTQRVKNFTPLHFVGQAIKGVKLSTMDLSGMQITSEGGQVAKGKASIRRWTAPLDGQVDVYAELVHANKTGDGVICRLVSSRLGVLGEWSAQNTAVSTRLSEVEVKRGDTLDFLTVCRSDPTGDTYKWSPTITMRSAELPGMKGMPMRWDAKSNFMDPAKVPQPLGPLEELAQVLMLSNEFALID